MGDKATVGWTHLQNNCGALCIGTIPRYPDNTTFMPPGLHLLSNSYIQAFKYHAFFLNVGPT